MSCETARVNSWRDSVGEAVQKDLDGLVSVALKAASKVLTHNGKFYPVGFWISDDGVAMFSADAGPGARPTAMEVLRTLGEAARAERDRLRSVAETSAVREDDPEANSFGIGDDALNCRNSIATRVRSVCSHVPHSGTQAFRQRGKSKSQSRADLMPAIRAFGRCVNSPPAGRSSTAAHSR